MLKERLRKLNELRMKVRIIVLMLVGMCAMHTSFYGQQSNTENTTVFLIGVDGMSVDGLTKANTPNMDALMQDGASSLYARGVMPTSSGPNWGSMLLGAGPEEHGIVSNAWRVNNVKIAPLVQDSLGFFPSVFDIIKRDNSKAILGVFHEWGTIKELFNNNAVDKIEQTKQMDETLEKAFSFYKKEKANFVFAHLDAVDHAGHDFGHGTKEYYHAIELIDAAIGKFIKGLKALKKYSEVTIIVTADHGGVAKSHGGSTMEEIQIPWIITGPKVSKGKTIKTRINTYDTPATIAWLLGAATHIPQVWLGKPVMSAFE